MFAKQNYQRVMKNTKFLNPTAVSGVNPVINFFFVVCLHQL